MKKIKGDLVELFDNGHFDVIVNGLNCFCTMNSGIAKQITNRWPEVKQDDLNTVKGDVMKLGTSVFTFVDTFRKPPFYDVGIIISAYTQYNYGNDGKRYVDYAAIKSAFKNLAYIYDDRLKIGIPRIGAGRHTGGNWSIIEDIIERSAPFLDITLVELE